MPLDAAVAALSRRNSWEAACVLVETALLRACSGDGRGLYEAFWAAERLCGEFRPAPARLLPALRAVLSWRGEGPHVHPWVASLPGDAAELIGRFGAEAAPAADALLALALGAASPENADRALAALVRLGDGRSPSLLAEYLPDRPAALRSAADHGLPFTPVLLAAIRELLRAAPKTPADESGPLLPMLTLLSGWGPRAHEAAPELCDALEEGSDVPERLASTLAAVGGSGPGRERAEAVLRRVVSDGGPRERLAAARALRLLAGDAAPLLSEVAALLGGKGSREEKSLRQDAAEACRELGEEARPLLPVLLPLLEQARPRRLPWLVDVAAAVWRLTGEPEHVLPVLDAALVSPAAAAKAVLAVREQGPAAAALADRVARRLYDLYELPETVRTLIRMCPDGRRPPEGCSPARLIDLLLVCAGEAQDPSPAFEVIAELGAEHLTVSHRRLLHGYAFQDRRVPRRHSPPDITADGVLRAASRALLDDPAVPEP